MTGVGRGPSTGSRGIAAYGGATGSRGRVVGDAPRRAPLDTGFRGTTRGGVRGQPWCCEAGAPVEGCGPPFTLRFPFPLRRRALREAPLPATGMTRDAGECGGRGTRVPRPAPALDSRFRGNDDGGVRAGGGCWWRRGESPAAAGRALREAPLRRGVGVGDATGVGGGRPFDRLRANGIAVRVRRGGGGLRVGVRRRACDGGGEGGGVARVTLRGGGSSGR